jgi:hypothetical protein
MSAPMLHTDAPQADPSTARGLRLRLKPGRQPGGVVQGAGGRDQHSWPPNFGICSTSSRRGWAASTGSSMTRISGRQHRCASTLGATR